MKRFIPVLLITGALAGAAAPAAVIMTANAVPVAAVASAATPQMHYYG
jgi:hypothetical protein